MKMNAAENILSRQGGPIQFLSCIIQSVENSTTAGVRINLYFGQILNNSHYLMEISSQYLAKYKLFSESDFDNYVN